ncbi:MAG: tRNA adenosine(34) deaminase TadA [Syntrophaceae bacterium]|nr:tRNA adenosine(34) deaminase TadA [Syntrophaceae bacterium]
MVERIARYFLQTSTKKDERFMRLALELARKAFQEGETPVAAILVINDEIVSQAHNLIETNSDPTAHAEIIALRQASIKLADWRLLYSTLYVTLEPCIMCAGALLHARVPKVVYAAEDKNWGAFGSLFDFSHDPRINHEVEIVSGVMRDEAVELMKKFFQHLRQA